MAEYEDINPLSEFTKGPNCGKVKEDEKNEPIYHVELMWDICQKDDGSYFKVRVGAVKPLVSLIISSLAISASLY